MVWRRQRYVELLLMMAVEAACHVLFLFHGVLADLNSTNTRQILKQTEIRLGIKWMELVSTIVVAHHSIFPFLDLRTETD